MTETKLLIGSLSNDLFRVANMIHRGSFKGANRFFQEAKRWSLELSDHQLKDYLKKILADINEKNYNLRSMETAEELLMYAVQLQNHALHSK